MLRRQQKGTSPSLIRWRILIFVKGGFHFHSSIASSQLSISLSTMTVAWFSSGHAISSVDWTTRNFKSPASPKAHSFRRHKPHPFVSRNLLRIRAKVLQDEEKKLAAESLPLKTPSLPDHESKGSNHEPSQLEDWIIKVEQGVNIFLTDSVIKVLDTFYRDRHYARFFVLETIARVPYFAFISVLHLYESFGWWRKADYLKVHFAESWNEMHHLLIMEELGGNSWWFDRFLAQHIAVAYYFMTVVMYALSPRMAYHFSECVENHAFSTYDKFIKAQGEDLKRSPAPEIAVKYYTGGDLYLFDEFQTSRLPNSRRPKIENLYDVFLNIRDDEAEHCKTMKACQTHGNLRSPHSYTEEELAGCEGIIDCIAKSVTDQSL